MNTKKDIGKLISERLEEATFVADEKQWELISQRLDGKKKRKKRFLLWLMLFTAGGFGSLILFSPSEEKIENREIHSKVESTHSNTTEETFEITDLTPTQTPEKSEVPEVSKMSEVSEVSEVLEVSEVSEVSDSKIPKKKKAHTKTYPPKVDTTTVVTTTYSYYNNSTGEELNTHNPKIIDSILNTEEKTLEKGKEPDSIPK